MKEMFVKVYQSTRNWLKNAFSYIKKRQIIAAFAFACGIVLAAGLMVLTVSLAIKADTSDKIITADEAKALDGVDYIVVLGAGLRQDGSPSDMLTDRLLTGIDLASENKKLLLTGDNSGEHYNEVGAMYDFALNEGVDKKLIVLDDYGFSTYESIVRAKEEFCAEKIIIITQEYHLYRALYIADELGLDAYGVSADIRTYRGQLYRDAREHLARVKDFFKCLIEEDT